MDEVNDRQKDLLELNLHKTVCFAWVPVRRARFRQRQFLPNMIGHGNFVFPLRITVAFVRPHNGGFLAGWFCNSKQWFSINSTYVAE